MKVICGKTLTKKKYINKKKKKLDKDSVLMGNEQQSQKDQQDLTLL